MLYRVSFDKNVKGHILIEDVVEANENLFEGYTTRYGVNVQKIISSKDFFDALKYAIYRCDTIMNIVFENGKYRIDWLEIKDGVSVMHHDTFELDSHDHDFEQGLEQYRKAFSKVDVPTRMRLTKRRLKCAREEDMFKKCADLLYSYSVDRKPLNTDEKSATLMYSFIMDNLSEFKASPTKIDKSSTKKMAYMNFARFVGLALSVLNVVAGVLTANIFFILVWAVYFLYGNRLINSEIRNIKSQNTEEYCSSFIAELKKLVDYDYLKVIENDKREEQQFGLVDVINRPIERSRKYDKSFIERLLSLEIEYSIDKCGEIDEEHEQIDKFSYVYRLLDIEQEMYSRNKGVGLLHREPEVDVKYLYDILRYLGWEKSDVLHDTDLCEIISSMKGLIESPYEGVEVDLIEMIRFAVMYVGLYSMCTDNLDGNGDEVKVNLGTKLDALFEEASIKYNEAVRLEKAAVQADEKVRAQGIAQVGSPAAEVKQMKFNMVKSYKIY